ncbi:MAG: sulfatase-like hydrolase/transferase [Armatimonadota bacterium]
MARHNTPNILVFFCDQLRIDLLGCYGGTLVRTPNLDALARDAMVFDRAYTPTAICSPARASLLTGLYPHHHHLFNNSTPGYSYCEHLRPDLTTLQDWVDAATPYETAYFGKWHIGPAQDLFDSRFHRTQRPYEGGPAFLHNSHWHPNASLGPWVTRVADSNAGTVDVPMEGFPDVVAARYTRNFLQTRDAGRPFLAFCAFPGPHSPWIVPHEFGVRYDPAEIPPWPNRDDPFDGKPINQRKLRALEAYSGGAMQTHLPEMLAHCFSYLELIDQQVGEVVADLRALDLYDDTAIVFTADHGDMAGSHGLSSKGAYMYDEIYRIPLLVKPAGAPAPRRTAAPVQLMDITATLAHLMAGEAVPALGAQPLDGQSLAPLLAGGTDWPRQVHYAEYHGDWYGHYSSRMVTDGTCKLVWNLSDLCELYDLANDPHELHNRFDDPAAREARDHYFALLIEEGRRTGDAHIALLRPEVEDLVHGLTQS